MSDEELNIEDVGGGAEDVEAGVGGKKTGFLPSAVITILKWAAIGLGFIILGVTTTLITYNIINKGSTSTQVVQKSEDYRRGSEILETYDGIGTIRGTTSGENPAIWSGQIKLAYPLNEKQLQEELIKRKDQLSNLIMKLLSQKKFSEMQPNSYDTIEEEIRQLVNRELIAGKIEEVWLSDFTVIP